MHLPRVPGSVIESNDGVWFVLYPPDTETKRFEWRSSGGDIFFSDLDSVKRLIAFGNPLLVDEYGLDSYPHTTAAYENAETNA